MAYIFCLSKKDNTCLIHRVVGKDPVVALPSHIKLRGRLYSVTQLGMGSPMFEDKFSVQKVVIPSTVTKIDDKAFSHCTNLAEVEIPPTVKFIGTAAFADCDKLHANNKVMQQLAQITAHSNTGLTVDDICRNPQAQTETFDAPKRAATPVAAVPASDIDINLPQATTSNDKTFAFIIANENYENVPKVQYALNDGKTVARYCNQVLGIPQDNIKTFYDATFMNMNKALRTMAGIGEVYGGDATFIFYYAGHGFPNEAGGDSYLLPVDGDGNDVESGYSLRKLYERLAEIPSRGTMLFMDACFSGSQRGEGMLVAARGAGIKAKAEAPKGKMVVLSAAQGDETAYPDSEKGHGMFTYFLLKKLQETRGEATLDDLSAYVTQQVSRRSIVKNNKSQTPSTQASPALGESWKEWKLK